MLACVWLYSSRTHSLFKYMQRPLYLLDFLTVPLKKFWQRFVVNLSARSKIIYSKIFRWKCRSFQIKRYKRIIRQSCFPSVMIAFWKCIIIEIQVYGTYWNGVAYWSMWSDFKDVPLFWSIMSLINAPSAMNCKLWCQLFHLFGSKNQVKTKRSVMRQETSLCKSIYLCKKMRNKSHRI